jgi:hypothetical protein
MKNRLTLSVLVLLLISGCAQEHKVEHTLDCVLKSVVYTETGKEVVFKREDAIRNGFEYSFRIYDDGTVVVNDVDVYVKDKNIERSYSLKIADSVDKNMKFQFTKAFDDVRFVLVKKRQEYTYSCSNTKETVNK